jgi:hypothetical protein
MVMATAEQVREWARETGRAVADKGKLSPRLRADYEQAHSGNGAGPPAADYPAGMSDADFDVADAAEPPDSDDTGETRPRPLPKPRSRTVSGLFQRGGAKSRKRPGKAGPRTSTAELFGSGLRIVAKLAEPMPPMYRTLRLESVIGGQLLDDAVKGTVVDRILQPIARMTEAGQVAAALVLPPAGIGAMAVHVQTAARQGREPNPVVMQTCAEMTRHGFLALMKVGGERFAEQLARERDDEERYGASVDAIMAWVMAPPADAGEEEATLRRMASFLAGETPADAETMPA